MEAYNIVFDEERDAEFVVDRRSIFNPNQKKGGLQGNNN